MLPWLLCVWALFVWGLLAGLTEDGDESSDTDDIVPLYTFSPVSSLLTSYGTERPSTSPVRHGRKCAAEYFDSAGITSGDPAVDWYIIGSIAYLGVRL